MKHYYTVVLCHFSYSLFTKAQCLECFIDMREMITYLIYFCKITKRTIEIQTKNSIIRQIAPNILFG